MSRQLGTSGLDYYDDMDDVIRQLRKLFVSPNFKSQKDADAALATARSIINGGRERHVEWARNGMAEDFRNAYRESGQTGAIPKDARDLSYRRRKLMERRGIVALNSLDVWAQQKSRDAFLSSRIKTGDRLQEQAFQKARAARTKGEREAALLEYKKLQEATEQYRTQRAGAAVPSDDPTIVYRYRKARTVGPRRFADVQTGEILLDGDRRLRQVPPGEFSDNYRAIGRASKKQGDIAAVHSAEDYFRMVANTGQQEMDTLGFLSGVIKDGGEVLVSDGPGCGWTEHKDPDKANGMIVSAEVAMETPLAHPSCQRTFQLLKGPRGSKRFYDSLREMTGVRNLRDLERIAKVGAVAGTAMATVRSIAKSPLVLSTVRNIVADGDLNLPAPVRAGLQQWTARYVARERTAMTAAGMDPDIDADDFRMKFQRAIDDRFRNEEFVLAPASQAFELSSEQARILGLRATASKQQIINAIEDYADHARHQRSSRLTMAQNIAEQAAETEARLQIHGEAAIRYNLAKPRTGGALSDLEKALTIARDSYRVSPEYARQELFKELALGVSNFLPWPKVNLSKFRLMVGMPYQGRMDLANFVAAKFGPPAWSATDRRYAMRLGLELPERQAAPLEMKRLLRPRITYLPGRVFSATVGLENGILAPALRMYPGNTFLRHLSLEYRLTSEGMSDLIREFSENASALTSGSANNRWKTLRSLLGTLDEASLYSLNIFRRGPISANLVMKSDGMQSFSINMRPANSWIRHNYRFMNKGRTVTWAGQEISETITMLSREVTLLPRLAGGVLLRESMDAWTAIVGMLQWRGSVGEVARALGVSYEDMVRFVNQLEIDLEGQFTKFWDEASALSRSLQAVGGARGIRNLSDIQALANRYRLESSNSQLVKARSAARPDMTEFVDESILSNPNVHSSLLDDIENFLKLWRIEHPRMQPPRFEMNESSTPLTYNRFSKTIYIDAESAQNWVASGRIRQKAVEAGFFPRGTDVTAGSVVHEAGHHFSFSLSAGRYGMLWDALLNSGPRWGRVLPNIDISDRANTRIAIKTWMQNPAIKQQIQSRVSVYASLGPEELLAEIYTEAMTSSRPGPLGLELLEFMRKHTQ